MAIRKNLKYSPILVCQKLIETEINQQARMCLTRDFVTANSNCAIQQPISKSRENEVSVIDRRLQ